MHILPNTTIAIAVYLLLFIPLFVLAIKFKLWEHFSFGKFILLLNKALLWQFVLGLALFIVAFVLNKMYPEEDAKSFIATFKEVTFGYSTVGLFIYLPVVMALNLIKYFAAKYSNRTPTK
jgi:hypothetical protein